MSHTCITSNDNNSNNSKIKNNKDSIYGVVIKTQLFLQVQPMND